MEPNWVRPVYLYLLSLVGVVVMAVGAVGAVLGLVHIAAPDLGKGSDPVIQIASTVIDVIVGTVPVEELGGPEAAEALATARSELRSQTREAALNDLIRSIVIILVGAGIYTYHQRRITPPPRAAFGEPTTLPPPIA